MKGSMDWAVSTPVGKPVSRYQAKKMGGRRQKRSGGRRARRRRR